jgi:hypothetical protein
MGHKRRLHGMEIFRLAESFNRRDLIALVHRGKDETRIHPPAVDVHRASAALAVIASLLRSGEMEVLAETIEKRGARIDPKIVLLPVDPKRDRNRILRDR